LLKARQQTQQQARANWVEAPQRANECAFAAYLVLPTMWRGSVCERSHDRRDNRCYNVSVNTTDLPAQDTHTLHDPTKHLFIKSEFERRTKHRLLPAATVTGSRL